MGYEELLKYLDIEGPEEFEYFENFADLIESENEIADDALYKLINGCDKDNLMEIIENYFEEAMDAVPDDAAEIYTLLETIKMSLIGLLQSAEEEAALVHFCEELLNFRQWYNVDSVVHCRNTDDNTILNLPLRDALTLSRVEKLEDDSYNYDFNDTLNYDLEEYIMSYADMARAARDDVEDDGYDDNYDDIESY